MRGTCPVCSHLESYTIDRFLCMPVGTPGKRGARSLAPVFGLDRRDIAEHDGSCLTDERRERVLRGLGRMAKPSGVVADEGAAGSGA